MSIRRNLEDAFMIREAVKSARAQEKREHEITTLVTDTLSRLRNALVEDFHLEDTEIVHRILEKVTP